VMVAAPTPAPTTMPAAATVAATPGAAARTFVVLFAFDSAELDEGAHKTIAEAEPRMVQSGTGQITVTGYTDLSGPERYNDKLSSRRADVVKAELVRLGLSADRIDTAGRGMRDPAMPTPFGVREPQNRRVESSF
jgi:OmpA-OmpF porin, OOP family